MLFKVTTKKLKTLNLLRQHPGIGCGQFAALMWPHLIGQTGLPHMMIPSLLAYQYLNKLRTMGLVDRKPNGNPWKQKGLKMVYYLSAYGWEVYENENRARRSGLPGCARWRARPLTKRLRAKTLRPIGERVQGWVL
jgi:hypothetical protein